MKRLLLLGGGHSHVEVLRRFALDSPPGACVQLVTPARHAPYSGMLPGFVAGYYGFEDCHIDLAPLCRAAHADMRLARACALDPDAHRVTCDDGAVLDYDMLSIDTGSTPDAASIAGAAEHATAMKPVEEFIAAWHRIRDSASDGGQQLSVVVVGGGAGGIEIAFAMRHRLDAGTHVVQVVTDSEVLLPGYPRRARQLVERAFAARDIRAHVGCRVTRVEPGRLHLAGRPPVVADHVFLATGASAPGWIAASGLETDQRGFLAVDDTLQSLSHPGVFAAGDVASMVNHPRPKAGVYAVRQGPALAGNLRRALAGKALSTYLPQQTALALISTGDRRAIACLGRIALGGRWAWYWKDWIDCRFMATYRIDA